VFSVPPIRATPRLDSRVSGAIALASQTAPERATASATERLLDDLVAAGPHLSERDRQRGTVADDRIGDTAIAPTIARLPLSEAVATSRRFAARSTGLWPCQLTSCVARGP
jgi:hypothetical protein